MVLILLCHQQVPMGIMPKNNTLSDQWMYKEKK
jgi:hypothetical protein